MPTILIIEDDTNIRFSIETALNDEGYSVISCDNGSDGLAVANKLSPDLILLDLLLPELDGRDLLTAYRANNTVTPIIILTALSDVKNKVECLDNGANDYIDKPFSLDELLARIRVCLRNEKKESTPNQHNETLCFGDMIIDPTNETVKIKNHTIYLKRKEYALLIALAKNEGSLVKRKQLIQSIWNDDISSGSNTIDTHIHSLRKALGKYSDYEFILTEYGRGYRFQPKLKTNVTQS